MGAPRPRAHSRVGSRGIMHSKDVMKGAPPPPEAQVTRANWRTFPAIGWSFRNVRQLLPTARCHGAGAGA